MFPATRFSFLGSPLSCVAALTGACFRILHDLHYHEWMGASLQRWLLVLLWVLAGAALLRLLPGGPVLALLLFGFALLLILGQAWARRRLYVHFRAGAPSSVPEGRTALRPQDKVLVRATGLFSVDGHEAAWTDLIAYYRTFASREHALMARRTPSRFLGFGERDPETLGMWYIFITPETLKSVTPGRLYFGRLPRPALHLDYRRRTRKGKVRPAAAYLSFESDVERETVWADLR